MAGDKSTLYINDENKKELDSFYVGEMRYYQNMFSLKKYKYANRQPSLYSMEERLSDGRTSYSVWDDTIFDEIKQSLQTTPVTDQERRAYEDAKDLMEWVEEVKQEYSNESIHFVFVTDHDW